MVLPFFQLARWPGTAPVWGLMLAMIACDIASQFCLSHGLATVPMARGTTILLLIPVLSLLAGIVVFGEHLSLRQWLSCVLVLAAAALAVIARAPMPSGRNVAGASSVGRGMINEPNPEQDAPATLDKQGDIAL